MSRPCTATGSPAKNGIPAGLGQTASGRHDDGILAGDPPSGRRGGTRAAAWYIELHPQAIGGFVELVTIPGWSQYARRFLGRNSKSWRSDSIGHSRARKTSRGTAISLAAWEWSRPLHHVLAFNIIGVHITPDMGTHWDDGRSWKAEMFPDSSLRPRHHERAVRKYPATVDISCRSALTVHRGTAHPSPVARPVLVLGVGTPGTGHSALHDMMVTTRFYDRLPEFVRKHLVCRIWKAPPTSWL
jgi:hypothetical protein